MGCANQDTTRKDASNQLKPSRKADGVVLLGWPFIFEGILKSWRDCLGKPYNESSWD